jgi:hypothetical protein
MLLPAGTDGHKWVEKDEPNRKTVMANKPAALNKQGQLGPKAKQGTGDFGPPGESAKSGRGAVPQKSVPGRKRKKR